MPDWVVYATVGVMFLILGILKIYGVIAGIEGGGKASFAQQLCGT